MRETSCAPPNMENYMTHPAFIHDLPTEEAQPFSVESQGPFVAVVQWDGTGEFQHWVLIPKAEIETFIAQVREAAQ